MRLEEQGIGVRGKRGNEEAVAGLEDTYFSSRIAYDANRMASVYVAFFCLENAVRELITERLLERHGIDWWNTKVPAKIKAAVEKLKEKESYLRRVVCPLRDLF